MGQCDTREASKQACHHLSNTEGKFLYVDKFTYVLGEIIGFTLSRQKSILQSILFLSSFLNLLNLLLLNPRPHQRKLYNLKIFFDFAQSEKPTCSRDNRLVDLSSCAVFVYFVGLSRVTGPETFFPTWKQILLQHTMRLVDSTKAQPHSK